MTGSPMSGRVSLINDRSKSIRLKDLIVEGAEEMGYANIGTLTVKKPYDEQADYATAPLTRTSLR